LSTTPWGTPEGPAIRGGAYPRALYHRYQKFPDGSAAAILGPDPRLEVIDEIDHDHVERCDVVVVGSGAGGAVVAKELAEAGRSVIVLEEGGYFTRDDFTGPPMRRFQKVCRDAGTTQIVAFPNIPLPVGKAVGGTTVINSGTCWRAPDKVLREWGSGYGVRDADPETMRPYFEKVERIQNIRPVPWDVIGRNAELTHAGVVELGLSGGPLLRNITDCHGCGTCAMGCPTNAKQAMHVSYLPLAQRAGARIYAHARADLVLTEGGRARGVEAAIVDPVTLRRRATLTVFAPVVVVCAGTVHTPVLLKRSSLGMRSRQLGRNLRIHPALGVAGVFGEDVSSWKGTLQSYFVDTLFDSDEVMLEATSAVPSLAGASLPGIGRQTKDLLPGMRNLVSIGLYVSDTSSGRVWVVPGRREPVLTYKLNDLDFGRLLKGMRLAAEILLAAGAMMALVGLPGMPAVTSRADLDRITDGGWTTKQLRPTAFHPMGTARMGPDGLGVVDSWGAVHGARGVWVADGSIFPTCVAVNPQESIMAFATRTAERIARSAA
jgi:choline dehydrogenase-like flavoprotein